MMNLQLNDITIPAGTTYYWNPYSPTRYTVIQSPTTPSGSNANGGGYCGTPTSSSAGFAASASSDDEGSVLAGYGGNASSMSFTSMNNNSMTNLKAPNGGAAGGHQMPQLPHAGPTEEVYNMGWQAISAVRRQQTTDSGIGHFVRRYNHQTLMAMVQVIEFSPNLFLELCERERGNVVASVIQALQGEGCDELVNLTADHILRLATNQSGCIALTRIFDSCHDHYKQSIAMALLPYLDQLATHQYGNFMVSEVLKTAGHQQTHNMSFIFDRLADAWSQPSLFVQLAESKFGSHCLETLLKVAPAAASQRLCQNMFSHGEGIDAVVRAGFHRQGNYAAQAVFRCCHAAQGDLFAVARDQVLPLLHDSDNARNLSKALMNPGHGPSNNNSFGGKPHFKPRQGQRHHQQHRTPYGAH